MSDGCLNFKRISAQPDGARIEEGEKTWEDDVPGNQFDTEETVQEVFTHNQVYDKICSKRGSE